MTGRNADKYKVGFLLRQPINEMPESLVDGCLEPRHSAALESVS